MQMVSGLIRARRPLAAVALGVVVVLGAGGLVARGEPVPLADNMAAPLDFPFYFAVFLGSDETRWATQFRTTAEAYVIDSFSAFLR